MTDSNKPVSPLRRRMLDDMTMRKLQQKTRAAYIPAAKNFTHFFGRSISWRCHRPDQRTCQHWRSRIFSPTTARPAPRYHRRLHTWGSALTHHPHIHCIVPGAGLSLDGERWVHL